MDTWTVPRLPLRWRFFPDRAARRRFSLLFGPRSRRCPSREQRILSSMLDRILGSARAPFATMPQIGAGPLDAALRGPAALEAEVGEVGAYGERDQDYREVYESGIRRGLQIVRVPSVQARRPCKQHVDAYNEEHGSRSPSQLHGSFEYSRRIGGH